MMKNYYITFKNNTFVMIGNVVFDERCVARVMAVSYSNALKSSKIFGDAVLAVSAEATFTEAYGGDLCCFPRGVIDVPFTSALAGPTRKRSGGESVDDLTARAVGSSHLQPFLDEIRESKCPVKEEDAEVLVMAAITWFLSVTADSKIKTKEDMVLFMKELNTEITSRTLSLIMAKLFKEG